MDVDGCWKNIFSLNTNMNYCSVSDPDPSFFPTKNTDPLQNLTDLDPSMEHLNLKKVIK